MESIFDSRMFNENLFFPYKNPYFDTPENAEEMYVAVEKDVILHVRTYDSRGAKLSLLYFHGNGEMVTDHDHIAPDFLSIGAQMVVSDYRGYGVSTGTPTLRLAFQDAHTIYRYLLDNGKLLPKVVVMGRSLGSGPAIELCSKITEFAGCVIESGYADPICLLERRGIIEIQITPEDDAVFNNSGKIRSVKCPLLIMHGEKDTLIEPSEAEMNYQNAGSVRKKLAILPGVGHNTIYIHSLYLATLHEFFEEIASS